MDFCLQPIESIPFSSEASDIAPNLANPTLAWGDWFAAGLRSRSPQSQRRRNFNPEQPKKSSEPGNVIDFVATKITVSPIAPRGASPADKWMALVKLASLRDAMACCCGGLRERSRHFGRGLRSAGTNFGAPLYGRHTKDYAMAAINGTLAPVAIPISPAPLESTTNGRSSMKAFAC